MIDKNINWDGRVVQKTDGNLCVTGERGARQTGDVCVLLETFMWKARFMGKWIIVKTEGCDPRLSLTLNQRIKSSF